MVRAALGVVVLVAAGLAAHWGHPTVVEVNVFRLINELPSAFRAPLVSVMQLGALGAVPVAGAITALSGRYRLSAVLVITGGAAWAASKGVQWFVDEEPPTLRIARVLSRGGGGRGAGLAFPASHVAVAAALTVAATPYLRRSHRRACWFVVALIAAARIYLGLHLPLDAVGGLALGVAVGAAVNLVAGVPASGPSVARLTALLQPLGLVAESVDPGDTPDHLRWHVVAGHDYLVKTLAWGRPEQGWLSRLWRLVAYRQPSVTPPASSPSQRAGHQAHMSLLAERSGARTPSLLLVNDIGPQTSVVVRRWVDATPLAVVADGDITDDVLADAWRQLARVHQAGIVHGRVHPHHLLVGGDGEIWIVGWGAARAARDSVGREADLAEMAVTLASRAGVARTVDAARRVVTAEGLNGVLGQLQTLALRRTARELAVRNPELLPALRSEIAKLQGREVPPSVSMSRVAIGNLVPLAGLGVAVYVLLPQLARSSTSLSRVGPLQWPWLIGVAGAGGLTYLMGAAALMAAAGRRLPILRTLCSQLAAAFTNRVVPAGLGAAATNIRYLELSGMDRPSAVSAVGLNAIGGFSVHSIATVVAVTLLRRRAIALRVPDVDPTWPALLGLVAGCVAIGWVVWVRRLHVPVLRGIVVATASAGAILTQPVRLVSLLAANAGVSAAYILALSLTLAAYGVHPGLETVAGVYLASSAIAAVAPTPGGVGPFEAAAVAGFGALGVSAGTAVATVITYRLITYWLPVAPGAIGLRFLRRRGWL